MKSFCVNLLIFVSYIGFCLGRRYDNFVLYSTIPTEQYQLNFLQNLESQKYIDVIFWKRPSKLFNGVHFVVNPVDLELLQERLKHFKLDVQTLLPNIQSAFDSQTFKKYTSLDTDSYSWDFYHNLEDIYQWLSDLALKFPKTVELHSIGRSVEGRDIYALFIKRSKAKANVIVDGGIHGNEWISIAFVTYLIKQLIYSQDVGHGRFNELANNYHWFLIPVVNPDGFDYSVKTERMWRKNRGKFDNGDGVDLNRNFDYNFGKFDSSNNSKDDNYCGAAPFSEPESKTLSDFITEKRDRLKFYISFHAYGQKIIIPYDDRVQHMENFSEMENYGKQAILRLYQLFGVKYSVGTIYDTFGLRASGSSTSWVKSNFKTKYVVTFVLRDNGTYGYALPNNQILPTCEETLEGLIEFMTARPRRIRADLFNTAYKVTANIILLLMSCFLK